VIPVRTLPLVLFCALALSVCCQGKAHAAPKTIYVNDTEITLPHIVGLDDELMNIPDFREYMDHLAPSTNTLQWAYISLKDKQQLLQGIDDGFQSYILVETEKITERYQLTTSQFHTLQDKLRKQHNTLFTDYKSITEKTLHEQIDRFNSSYGIKLDVKKPAFQSIGIIADAEHYTTIAYRLTANVNMNGTVTQIDQAVLINVILTANKLLYVYVYEDYRDGKGLKEAISISQEFVDKVLKTNPNRG
jgi:hypothetical protein